MIRFMRWKAGGRYIFAKGNWYNNLYLRYRGYRKHHTSFGWVMRKEGATCA